MKVQIKKLPSNYTIYRGRVVLKSSIAIPVPTTSTTATNAQGGMTLPSQLQYINALGDRVVNASVEDYLKRVSTKAIELISTTNKIQSTTSKLTQRISVLEKKAVTKPYTPPKVNPTYLTNQRGRPVDMNVLLTALEKDYGQLRQSLGGSSNLLRSTRTPSSNLSAESLLGKDKGTLNDLPNWYKKPADVSQSFTNVWLTLMDIREAVSDLKTQTTPTTCSAVTYGCAGSLVDSTGTVTGIRLIFTDTVLPSSGWKDTNTSKGSKITIKDSSLNSITKHCQIYQYLGNDVGFLIDNLGNLDTTSNFEVTVEYSFTDGASECAKTETLTLTNSTTCPTVSLSTATDKSFRVDLSGISVTAGYELAVKVEDPSGTIIQTARPPTTNTLWNTIINGLSSGTIYSVSVETTSKAGDISTCPKSSITTTKPACSTVSILNASFNVSTVALPFQEGAQQELLSCYSSGGTTQEFIAGFDTNNNPIIYKGDLAGGTCADGTFVKYGNGLSKDPTATIKCGTTMYPATGISISNAGSGWRFISVMTSPNNVIYYVYALYNEAMHRVDQVVFCCDCASVFITDSYDVTTTGTSYRKQYYCETLGRNKRRSELI